MEERPFPETYWGFVDPIGPRASYVEGKRFAESLVVNYGEAYGLDTKIIRIFNTYGPRMKLTDGRMVPDFIKAALEGSTLVIYGDETSTSTFNYISDCIEADQKMMASNERGPLNMGTPEVPPIQKVADLIVRIVGSRSTIGYHSRLPYEARQGVADISLAKEKLGWFPVVPLEDGLRNTIEDMKGSRVLRLEDLPLGSKGSA